MKSGGTTQITKGFNGSGRTALRFALACALAAGALPASFAGVGKKVSDVCARTTDAAYRAKYCTAAKDLRHGYNANVATSAVWSGVSVACGVACGKAVGGIVCQVAGYGGSASEGVLTKKFTDAIAAEGSRFATGAANRGGSAPADSTSGLSGTTTSSGGKVNGDACVTAGKTALKAFEKFSDSKTTEKSLTRLRDETRDMNTPVAQNQVGYSITGDTQNSGAVNGQSGFAASAGPCGDSAIRSALGAIRCAASTDPSLPPYVKSEEFLKDLQKATGRSPDAFFAGFENPGKAILDSPLTAGMAEGSQGKLAESLSDMEKFADAKNTKLASGEGETVAAVRARPGSADDETGFDVNGILAGVLGQMGEGTTDAQPREGGEIAIERRPAGNANAAEDRAISLFDRVQWRYGSVSARDRLGVQ